MERGVLRRDGGRVRVTVAVGDGLMAAGDGKTRRFGNRKACDDVFV